MRKIQHKSGGTATYIDGAYQTDDGYVIPDWAINTEDWQEIKDYEILSWRNHLTKIIREIPITCIADYDIHSVKRLSDREVFSLKDQVNEGSLKGEIYKFEENKGLLWVWFAGCGSLLCSIQKSKRKPILKTENGVELFEGDKAFWIHKEDLKGELCDINSTEICKMSPSYFVLHFSTKEAAEEYRLNNYRGLSLRDVKVVFDAVAYIKDVKKGFSKCENLIKSRLK